MTPLIKKFSIFMVALLMVSAFSGCMISQPYVDAIPSQSPLVSPARLEQHVRYLSETVYPRNHWEMEKLNAAADYIKKELENAGGQVTEQHFTVDGRQYRNILAHFGPLDGDLTIVGAHYDSFHDTPGADDNASGVAGLIELAYLYKTNPPKQPVELVAYTLEEPPYFATDEMGSAFHARLLKSSNRPVKLMISLEMIGYFSDESGSQNFPVSPLKLLYPDKGNFVAVVGRFAESQQVRTVKALMAGSSDLPVHSINAPQFIQGLDFSDHRNYWYEGFNAIMITDTAFYRNHHYHELTDTAEKLDYLRMAKVVQGVYTAIEYFDQYNN